MLANMVSDINTCSQLLEIVMTIERHAKIELILSRRQSNAIAITQKIKL